MATDKRRIAAFRNELETLSLDGFIISSKDEFLTEYVPEENQRLRWITGFTGSVGETVLLKEKAAIFVDGRYTTQAKKQVDGQIFSYENLHGNPPADWILQNCNEGDKIGFDPWHMSRRSFEILNKKASAKNIELVPITPHLVDLLWHDRPIKPTQPVFIHPIKYAGESFKVKRDKICKSLREKNIDATFITSLDSIAWFFNLRGNDSEYEPIFFSYLQINADGKIILYIKPEKITDEITSYLGSSVEIVPIQDTAHTMIEVSRNIKSISLDPLCTSQFIWSIFEDSDCEIKSELNLLSLPKALKNKAEIESTKNAHIKDGAALSEFLCWLETEGRFQNIREGDAADKLLSLRQERDGFVKPSFSSISSTEDNAAVIHYNHATGDNKKLPKECWYLIDSGGQYIDGTTDITRTVCYREPTKAQKEHYTLVLKGHISIATTKFPKGSSGANIDSLARQFLWQYGLDFAHGTGHGVGCFLSVHEGPASIASRSHVPIEKGMILSNEPGFYIEGEYGIRLENLVVTVESEHENFFEFETISFAPFQRALIDESLLTKSEILWLNTYHETVRDILKPIVNDETKSWLEEATRAIEL